ncbi:hypothetical protein [Nocardiopsis dassonvillei]|uniref:hypothetical protein n=1 Tax=Nocardiopsis dassonvillei TaxID=2014 RepID=UPI00366C3914
MSWSRKVACAVVATVLLSAVAGAGMWWGGGVFTRDGREATSWASSAGAFLLLSAPVWVWALRRPAVKQSRWGWGAQVRNMGAEQVRCTAPARA